MKQRTKYGENKNLKSKDIKGRTLDLKGLAQHDLAHDKGRHQHCIHIRGGGYRWKQSGEMTTWKTSHLNNIRQMFSKQNKKHNLTKRERLKHDITNNCQTVVKVKLFRALQIRTQL